MAQATGEFGQRRAARPMFAVTFSGICCEASTSSVSGPGQNFWANFKKFGGKSRASATACSMELTRIGKARFSGRPFWSSAGWV